MFTDLVIFDCDGVLLDSEVIACRAEASALTELGLHYSWQQVAERFAGTPENEMYALLEQESGREIPARYRARVKAEVDAEYLRGVEAIAGVETLLDGLSQPVCVASSSRPSKLALGLVRAGLYERFYPHVFSVKLVERGKPAPDIFLYAANAMGVAPERCLVVEDSVAGVTAARAAGMRVIGFIGGSHCFGGHDQRLIAAGADAVISALPELLGLISTGSAAAR